MTVVKLQGFSQFLINRLIFMFECKHEIDRIAAPAIRAACTARTS